ncbi:Oxygen-insensitive NADPH nitroreductase [Nitrosotalea sinensis]|uniref:Oxygen-insensitive NADPH nitroreductase n=1 Tax=Nitrosotalea sinensis TaxID=1499975 RepID=A0A2H1EFX9_9ARCH|nr:Oxygen-insensitive NADPH nitroreductase [Candidatus Nitrosotalea sinensis]
MDFFQVEPAYISKEGCRLIWKGNDEDDQDVIVLSKEELESLVELLSKESTGKVELEDEFSTIWVNTDTTQFRLKEHKMLEVKTQLLRKEILEYKKIPQEQKPIKIYPKEYFPSITIEDEDRTENNKTLDSILGNKDKTVTPESDFFRVIAIRRSTRNFDTTRLVEQWKIDKILAAADTAPTAGNFQGFEVFYVRNKEVKKRLVEAANNQPYVNAPVVLVFCKDPSRVKMNFRPEILAKFSLQDATLAAAYSQIAASALGLSSIWIGMIDEEKVRRIIDTNLIPSSILCIGYPHRNRPPKSRRKLKDLIHVIE